MSYCSIRPVQKEEELFQNNAMKEIPERKYVEGYRAVKAAAEEEINGEIAPENGMLVRTAAGEKSVRTKVRG